MGLFDFFKKKELTQIQNLNNDLANCNSSKKDLENRLEKYSSITNVENEVSNLSEKIRIQKLEFEELNNKYQNAKEIYKDLKHEISIFETNLDLSEFGVYEPV